MSRSEEKLETSIGQTMMTIQINKPKIIYWIFIILVFLVLVFKFNPTIKLWHSGGLYGFWLGVFGTILIMISLTYSVWKRVLDSKKFLGNVDIHIITGALGFVLILFHSNFHARGVAAIALFSLILIIITGVIGEIFSEKLKVVTKYWDYLHIAFSFVLIGGSIIHIVSAFIFHRGFK